MIAYTGKKLVLLGRRKNVISKRIFDDIYLSKWKLNMVIHILMHCCSFVINWRVASRIKPHIIKRNVTLLMMSNYFGQYIAGYRIYCCKTLTSSKQTSCYKIKCIWILNIIVMRVSNGDLWYDIILTSCARWEHYKTILDFIIIHHVLGRWILHGR